MNRTKAGRTGGMTVTVRVGEDLKKDYTSALDRSVSDNTRSHMGEVARIIRDESDNNLPDDEILRNGYLAPRRTAKMYSPSSRCIDMTTAISKVTERTGIPKDATRRRVLKLPIRDDYVELDWGEIIIYQSEGVNANANRASPTKGGSTNS